MVPGYAGDADAYAARTQALNLSSLWNLLEPRLAPAARVLDLGCGGGRDLAHFAARGFDCVGLDRDVEMARIAAAHAGVPVLRADLQALPVRDRAFDAVWAVGLLHEMPADARALGFSEIARVLKPGGFLLASLRLSRHFTRRDGARVIHGTSPREIRDTLRHAGFTWTTLRVDRVLGGPAEGRWLVALAQRNSRNACSARSTFTRFPSDDP
jgi:SAM-dependent methyltransferase